MSSSPPPPSATLDPTVPTPAPPHSDPKSNQESLSTVASAAPDQPGPSAGTTEAADDGGGLTKGEGNEGEGEDSDPKSDQESLSTVASAAPDQPGPSVVDDGGELTKGEGNEGEEEEEEEEGECGFCLFMKGGGCKDTFVAWEKCVENAEKSGEDIVDKCSKVTTLLKKCMDAHADYYEPILRAEHAVVDAAADATAASSDPALEEEKKGKDS